MVKRLWNRDQEIFKKGSFPHTDTGSICLTGHAPAVERYGSIFVYCSCKSNAHVSLLYMPILNKKSLNATKR